MAGQSTVDLCTHFKTNLHSRGHKPIKLHPQLYQVTVGMRALVYTVKNNIFLSVKPIFTKTLAK